MLYYGNLIKHFLTANSRHGTHSPFVYRLAEKVIYRKVPFAHGKAVLPAGFLFSYRHLLAELLSFIGIAEMGRYPTCAPEQAVWVDLDEVEGSEISRLVNEGTVVIVHEPYRTKSSWENLVNNPAITVSIDLFHFGILMNRSEQRKENFRLRYPYWR